MNKTWFTYAIAGLLAVSAIAYMTSDKWLPKAKPRVSIITSIWKGDQFIEGFLADITQQTIFADSELILVNPSSPGNEEPIILSYLEKYPNIIYVKLPQDPGLYACWNHAIRLSSGDYISNANIDDRSRLDALETHVKLLDENPDIDLAYSGYLVTEIPNETFANNHFRFCCEPPEFALKEMTKCLPGPRPVWRKSMHDRFGYFDETFASAGDMDMWLRATSKGSVFKKIPGYTTLFYLNPEGVSTTKEKEKARKRDLENLSLYIKYQDLWKK